MDHHHCGAQDAQQTTNLPMNIQPLIQEVRAEYGTARKTNDVEREFTHILYIYTKLLHIKRISLLILLMSGVQMVFDCCGAKFQDFTNNVLRCTENKA